MWHTSDSDSARGPPEDTEKEGGMCSHHPGICMTLRTDSIGSTQGYGRTLEETDCRWIWMGGGGLEAASASEKPRGSMRRS